MRMTTTFLMTTVTTVTRARKRRKMIV